MSSNQQQADITSSALAVCEIRALGRGEQKSRFKNPDYLAENFLPKNKKWRLNILRSALVYPFYKKRIERKAPGGLWFFYTRTKFFDDYISRYINTVKQVVVLGAGYDSRFFRFSNQNEYKEIMKNINWFEVDHPLTQAKKELQINSLFKNKNTNIQYVPFDFKKNLNELCMELERRGFSQDLPTLFLWEGGSYYFSNSVVVDLLNQISKMAAPQSYMAFDYLLKSFLLGDYSTYGSEQLAKGWKKDKEKIQFGLNPNEVANFLKNLDYEVIDDLSAHNLEQKYLVDSGGFNPGRHIHGCFRMVIAKVLSKK